MTFDTLGGSAQTPGWADMLGEAEAAALLGRSVEALRVLRSTGQVRAVETNDGVFYTLVSIRDFMDATTRITR